MPCQVFFQLFLRKFTIISWKPEPAGDSDVIYLYGYGRLFPDVAKQEKKACSGGIFFKAQDVAARRVLEDLQVEGLDDSQHMVEDI